MAQIYGAQLKYLRNLISMQEITETSEIWLRYVVNDLSILETALLY